MRDGSMVGMPTGMMPRSSSADDGVVVQGSSKWDFLFTDYTTPKVSVLRSPWLRTPELLLQLLVVAYIVGFRLCWCLSFFVPEEVIGHITTEVRPSVVDTECNDINVDCISLEVDMASYAYCHKDSIAQLENFNVTGCTKVDYLDAGPAQSIGSAFVTTMMSEYRQNWTEGGGRIWSNDYIDRKFVAGIDQYRFWMRPALLNFDHRGAAAFLRHHNGTLFRMPCYRDQCAHEEMFTDVPTCGTADQGSEVCASTNVVDEISVRKLLEFANVSLEDVHEGNGVPKRYVGTALALSVEYTDMDPWDFWRWPFGRKAKYIYSVQELKNTQSKYNNTRYQFSQHYRSNHDGTKRRVDHHAGVLVLISPHGHFGTFSMAHFFITLTVSVAMLQVAKIFVNSILARVYSFIPGVRHVHAMHWYYSGDRSPHDQQLLQQMKEGNAGSAEALLELDGREDKNKAKQMAKSLLE